MQKRCKKKINSSVETNITSHMNAQIVSVIEIKCKRKHSPFNSIYFYKFLLFMKETNHSTTTTHCLQLFHSIIINIFFLYDILLFNSISIELYLGYLLCKLV